MTPGCRPPMQVQSLGRYRIEKELGRGAMGRVFLAYDPEIDRRVAIKTIQIFANLPEADRVTARERFLREARSAGKLLHPGIVTIFDVGESDGIPYLAMELVEGHTLDQYCHDDELLPVPQVVGLVAAAAEALAFAHERGIIHRDIKPANLMRVGERAVKIMDFGLAKSATTSMTHDGALLGTPSYMSPEQVRGESPDGRADLFSLGVVCYEMLTGLKPFGGDSISSVLYRIVNEPPKEPSLHPDRVAAPLATFLERALAKSPEARFQDGAAFAAALRRAAAATAAATRGPQARAGGDRLDAGAAPRVPKPAPAAATGRQMRWIAGLIAVAALAAGAFFVFGRLSPPPVPPLELHVRTEPAGLPVRLNGAPLDGDVVRFPAGGPFGVLTVSDACRETKHRVEPADAGREIVLVLDPLRADVPVEAGVAGAVVTVNGEDAGAAPATVELDLCRDNRIVVAAPGFKPATATIPARATPKDARTAVTAIKLEAIPLGRLMLPATRVPLDFFVDGKPVTRTTAGLELPAGTHEVRATNDAHFVELTARVDVPEGGAATPAFAVPSLAQLVVQTFPPNCKVSLKRDGAPWRPLGETPLRALVAAGPYALRVEAPASGESQEREIRLAPGTNAPVRVSFGRSGR